MTSAHADTGAAWPFDEQALEQLRKEHRELDDQVCSIERKAYLSQGEDAELKRLKRLKLCKKDMIHLLSRRLGLSA